MEIFKNQKSDLLCEMLQCAVLCFQRPSLSSGWSVVGAKRGTGLESFTSHLPEPPEEDPCTICLDDLTLSPSIQLACKHHFHDRCIRQWFTSSSTCPLCQKHVLLSDEYPALS